MKTTWNLKLFYDGLTDPRIEKDIKKDQKACSDFLKKYEDKAFWSSEQKLFSSLIDYENLFEQLSSSKPLFFYFYKRCLDTSNPKIEARVNKLTEHYTKLENELLFFELKLGRIDSKLKRKYLKSSKLKHFRYYLQRLFEESKYHLSEKEERVLNLKSMPSHQLWTQGMEKLLNKQEILYKKNNIPISQALSMIPKLDTRGRRKLHKDIMVRLHQISDFAESEINAVYIDKKISDELRKFPKPFSSTFLGYENTDDEVFNMVDAVNNSVKISHEFYDLKSKIFKIQSFKYADRSAEMKFKNNQFAFKKTVEILKQSYSKLGDKYVKIFEKFLNNGQIDAFPKKHKEDGAFCSSSINNPSMILLNHVDSAGSFRAFAHEMGHAVHSELSKVQPPIYQYYSAVSAECASTLFEHFAFLEIVENLDEKEKIAALHNKLNEEIATVFRQISFFNFELDLHNRIRDKGFVPKEEIAKMMNRQMLKYLGSRFELSELDGYFFVCVPHLRNFFYVYSYAYGLLLSKIIFNRFRQDRGYLKQIERFLSAGGSESPHDIFKEIGIDTNSEKTWEEGLSVIKEDVESLKRMI